MRLLTILLLLACIAQAEEFSTLPDAPHLKTRTHGFVISRPSAGDPFVGDANVVHNAPSTFTKRDPTRDWKFWTGTGVLVGAMLYDQQKTLDGLKTTSCVELNGDNPHPSRGDLMARNLPVVAGITVAKYLLDKYSKAPSWSAESMDAVAATIHIHDGLKWNNCH